MQLDSAEHFFQSAIEIDPAYPHANYWLAQVRAWRGDDPTLWIGVARRAVLLSPRLSRTDSALSGALLALAEGEFVDACARYSKLASGRDSLNFAVWYGLGDCRARDTVVVKSTKSQSGWRFRSGYSTAIRAYLRALELVPSAHREFAGTGFERLEALLYTEIALRRGTSAGDSTVWVAYPSLMDDTLAFVPYHYADIASGRVAEPATAQAAIARNRSRLQKLVTGWVQEFPRSATAYETLARALEMQGRINGMGGADASALAATDRALSLTAQPELRRHLQLIRTRLLLISSQFSAARALADSMLAGADTATSQEADDIKSLAALTGRVQLTVKLLERSVPEAHFLTSDGQLLQPPLAVAEASRALLGYVSLGAPVDSVRSSQLRVERALGGYVPASETSRMRDATESLSLRSAYPVAPALSLQRVNGPGDYLLPIQLRASAGDSASVRSLLESTSPARKLIRPTDLAIALTYQEAWLLLQVGDSAAATQKLDASLNALPALGPYVLDLVPNTAFLVRSMALRSDLAASHGDAKTAKRWGAAVAELWAGADPTLQGVVARMRARAS